MRKPTVPVRPPAGKSDGVADSIPISGEPPDPAAAGRIWCVSTATDWTLVDDPLAAVQERLEREQTDRGQDVAVVSLDDVLHGSGYAAWSSFGSDDGSASLNICVYSSAERGDFLVLIGTPIGHEFVLAADPPALMDLLARWLPAVTAAGQLDRQEDEREERARRKRRGPTVYDARERRRMEYADDDLN